MEKNKRLMDEVASIASPRASDSQSVQLLDITLAGVNFVSPSRLPFHSPDTLSLRFSLPGKPRLHFAAVHLMAPPIHDDSGFRYTAKFVTVDPHTVEHIVQLSRPYGIVADDARIPDAHALPGQGQTDQASRN
ncbi:hypothetical protein [Massilia sp. 9I]|uniref:hypothetical protein n=1 Tax=Massilia sp. 9I TaxID=2653152 RepID=UPI00135A0CAD|nr:hypothetical protein [Massilia sp. 9I]